MTSFNMLDLLLTPPYRAGIITSMTLKKRMTMREIAKLAGVSRTAVSAVINKKSGSTRLSERTRRRIEAVLRQTTFKPSTIGRALKLGRSMMIGLVVPNPALSFVPEAIRAVEDFAEKEGCGVLLMTTRHDPAREEKVLDFMLERRVDGVLIGYAPAPKTLRTLRNRKVPAVSLFAYLSNPSPVSRFVCVEGPPVGYLAVRHLLELGHRHIACVDMMKCVKEGVALAASEYPGKKHIEHWVWDKSPAESTQVFGRWLEARPRPSAMFVYSDECACQVMNLALRKGIKIPDELALVGIDDIPAAQKAVIPLTTVRQPKYEQGWSAAEVLFDMIGGRPGKDVIFQPTLIKRETT